MNGAAAVARYTLLELSRRRVLLVFFIIGAAGIALLGIGLKLLYQVLSSNPNSFGTNNQSDPAVFNSFLELLFVSYLVQALSVFALLLAYGIGMTTIYHDLESGSVVSIFSKPVSRFAFAIGKIAAAVVGLLVIVGLLAVEARIAMLLFGGGLEAALTAQLVAAVANATVIMLIVLALSAWVNNILAAVITFIYYNVVTGVISTIHLLADSGVLGNDIVRSVFDILYWLVPHQLVSSAVRELAQRQLELSGSQAGNQAALATIPGPSGTGDILWWGFNVVFLGALVYLAVRRRQV
jgi:ABC-type transport system involved in multi-copper enzyme maturation permease subunit